MVREDRKEHLRAEANQKSPQAARRQEPAPSQQQIHSHRRQSRQSVATVRIGRHRTDFFPCRYGDCVTKATPWIVHLTATKIQHQLQPRLEPPREKLSTETGAKTLSVQSAGLRRTGRRGLLSAISRISTASEILGLLGRVTTGARAESRDIAQGNVGLWVRYGNPPAGAPHVFSTVGPNHTAAGAGRGGAEATAPGAPEAGRHPTVSIQKIRSVA